MLLIVKKFVVNFKKVSCYKESHVDQRGFPQLGTRISDVFHGKKTKKVSCSNESLLNREVLDSRCC